MNTTDAHLDALLRQSRPSPAVPQNFNHAVWQRIKHAKSNSPALWLESLTEILLRPRIALAALATLIVISATAGAYSATTTARESARDRYINTVVMP